MIYLIYISILISIISVFREKEIYNKLIPLLSIPTKISILLILYSYLNSQKLMIDVGIFYLLLSIGGTFIITSFLSRSDL